MKYLRPKGWSEFQHYTDRNPPWIKLHNALLRNYEFLQLSEPLQRHLIMFWLLASQHSGGCVPHDLVYITGQLTPKSAIDIDELIIHGFLDVLDAIPAISERPPKRKTRSDKGMQRQQNASTPLAKRLQNASPSQRQSKRERKSKNKDLKISAGAASPVANWVTRASEVWSREIGIVPPPRLGKALKPAVDAHGLDAVLAGIPRYAAATEGRARNPEWFVADIVRYVSAPRPEDLVDADGVVTEMGNRLFLQGSAR